jgi:hypothetical protein
MKITMMLDDRLTRVPLLPLRDLRGLIFVIFVALPMNLRG